MNIITKTLAFFLAITSPAASQDLELSMLSALGASILTNGDELLTDASEMLDEFLQSAEQGETFESSEACLGALQTAVSAGAIATNILPFSSVETFEDRRGPVAKFRILFNGSKVHVEAFCNEEKLAAFPLDWGNGNPTPKITNRSSFDALAGMFLLLHAQGAFDGSDTASKKVEKSSGYADETRYSSSELDELLDATLGQPTEELSASASPPLSLVEEQALRVAVQKCWNVGSLSSLALETTVVVAFSLTQDGKPVVASIRQVSSEGGTSASVQQAFETARRAIIRCGARGLQLPSYKYDQWKDLEMTFDPKGIRIK